MVWRGWESAAPGDARNGRSHGRELDRRNTAVEINPPAGGDER